MKLLNVRLRAEDAARVRDLRRRGVVVSEIVRAAIAQAASQGRSGPRRRPRDVGEFLRELDERYPIPSSEPHHAIDTTDRRALARHLRARFTRRGRR